MGQIASPTRGAAGFLAVQLFDVYEFERFAVPRAAESDLLLVNLFREPIAHRCARIRLMN